ncbi:hypothetical protein SE27_09715 [Acinetobacter harbinensis]|nr:hypothetical protein SE27_09715 [Acinetobacter harbinensis]
MDSSRSPAIHKILNTILNPKQIDIPIRAERAWFLILKFENDWSDQSIANAHGCSRAKVRSEVDKGLAYLDGKIEVFSD